MSRSGCHVISPNWLHQKHFGQGCWYLTITTECPICGRGETTRQRQWTAKPDDPSLRYRHETQYDYCDV